MSTTETTNVFINVLITLGKNDNKFESMVSILSVAIQPFANLMWRFKDKKKKILFFYETLHYKRLKFYCTITNGIVFTKRIMIRFQSTTHCVQWVIRITSALCVTPNAFTMHTHNTPITFALFEKHITLNTLTISRVCNRPSSPAYFKYSIIAHYFIAPYRISFCFGSHQYRHSFCRGLYVICNKISTIMMRTNKNTDVLYLIFSRLPG